MFRDQFRNAGKPGRGAPQRAGACGYGLSESTGTAGSTEHGTTHQCRQQRQFVGVSRQWRGARQRGFARCGGRSAVDPGPDQQGFSLARTPRSRGCRAEHDARLAAMVRLVHLQNDCHGGKRPVECRSFPDLEIARTAGRFLRRQPDRRQDLPAGKPVLAVHVCLGQHEKIRQRHPPSMAGGIRELHFGIKP